MKDTFQYSSSAVDHGCDDHVRILGAKLCRKELPSDTLGMKSKAVEGVQRAAVCACVQPIKSHQFLSVDVRECGPD